MSNPLSSVAEYLTSIWRSDPPKTGRIFSEQKNSCHLATTQLVTTNLNQMISDRLPGCTLIRATLEGTKDGKLSLFTGSGETIIFSNEKTLNQWFGDKQMADIWQIKDLRKGKSDTFYKLQRKNNCGYDTFETKEKLFDQLREDYGVFWKLEDQGEGQTSYIQYKSGIFSNSYVEVDHENLTFVANNLKLKNANFSASTPQSSEQTSWGKGIAACVVGGLLLSAGRSWSQSSGENPVSDAIAMMKGTIGPAAFKAAFAFQIAALSSREGGAIPGALLAGMMFLPEAVSGQPLCPIEVGNYTVPNLALDVAISGNYAYVGSQGLKVIDVSVVAAPTLVGSSDTSAYAFGVTITGNYAFLSVRSSGFQVIDVSIATDPTFVGSYNTPGQANDVAISGIYAYVADGSSGLQIIDVSNVTNPAFAGSYNTPGHANDVAISGIYAYVADSYGLQIIDVSNVADPTLVGTYHVPNEATSKVAVSGNYAYVANFGSFQIIDVSNVTNPTFVGSYATFYSIANDVALSNNYAYITGTGGFQIIDVSNKANPTLAGSYGASIGGGGVAVSGNYAYVTHGVDYNIGVLQIIDMSACPTSSNDLTTSSGSNYRGWAGVLTKYAKAGLANPFE